jgi:glutamate synthase (NADPH/NADH) large chain
MAELGFRTINEMVGRVDALNVDPALTHWKARGLDLRKILAPARQPENCLGVYAQHEQDHGLELALDNQLMKMAEPALASGSKVHKELDIVNTNRVVGGLLSNEIIRRVGPQMLEDDTIWFKFNGSAGQSFGAWLAKGVTLEVEGDANDFVGKGLSGGKVIVYPPKVSQFNAEDQVLVGNVVMYGATSGEAYFRGIAAERFCVRNSGAKAVVEGVGDHGCEYMTGGIAVILGPTGRNFAAGMSGGVAYVYDPQEQLATQCNMESIDLETLADKDASELKQLLTKHLEFTGSQVAQRILEDFDRAMQAFVKVMPTDYKRVLEQREALQAAAG